MWVGNSGWYCYKRNHWTGHAQRLQTTSVMGWCSEVTNHLCYGMMLRGYKPPLLWDDAQRLQTTSVMGWCSEVTNHLCHRMILYFSLISRIWIFLAVIYNYSILRTERGVEGDGVTPISNGYLRAWLCNYQMWLELVWVESIHVYRYIMSMWATEVGTPPNPAPPKHVRHNT